MIPYSLVLSFMVLLLLIKNSQGRTCCKYSCEHQCPEWCTSQQSCVLRNSLGYLENIDSNCTVVYDTKKDKTDESITNCLKEEFDVTKGFDSFLPFHVVAYPFKVNNQQGSDFTGIDLRYEYHESSNIKFRIMNTNPKVCPEHDSINESDMGLCHPRCVQIRKSKEQNIPKPSFLSYDCEAGFYISKTNWVKTDKDDYLLSICSENMCGEFLFKLPDLSSQKHKNTVEQRLVLLSKTILQDRSEIELFIPVIKNASYFQILLKREVDEKSNELVYNQTLTILEENNSLLQTTILDYSVSNGRYFLEILAMKDGVPVGPTMYSPHISKTGSGEYALPIIIAILITMLIVGIILSLYRRWQTVAEAGAVEPSILVSAGRMEEQAILIVTPLDNQDHVEVVKDLCRYLRDWCGVGKTYFAMDDDTGISSANRDPWKWCQETGDIVQEKGTIVFLAGPEPGLSDNISIHPNLEHNQAFLNTKHLHRMALEDRVIVAKFSYSSLKTLPEEVPAHLKTSAYHIPKQTNEFLLHLLQVKRRALFSFFPCPLVKPDVKPGDFSRTGGPELLNKIRELTLKASKFRLNVNLTNNKKEGTSLETKVYSSNEESNNEERRLLCQKIQDFSNLEPNKTLDIEIEKGIPSIKQMDDRNKLDTEDD